MRRFHGIILSLVLLGLFFAPVYAVNSVIAQGGDTDAVTITAAGNQSYLLGQEIQLFGINRESETVYLFITGPDLAPEGAPLHNPHVSVYGGGWTTIGVLPDNTWESRGRPLVSISMPGPTWSMRSRIPGQKRILANHRMDRYR